MTAKSSSAKSEPTTRFVAFLRGINVGGKNIIKMEVLRDTLAQAGYGNVKTVLASGNVLLDAALGKPESVTGELEKLLAAKLGREVGVLTRTLAQVQKIAATEPFAGIAITAQTRLYVTFLGAPAKSRLKIPYRSPEANFEILRVTNLEVYSVLTVTDDNHSTDAMKILEAEFGRKVTTRNWNTIQKIIKG